METLRRLVPSIGSLVVFEAAGRLSSFSAAARELGMSQAAVSYAIGRLEAQLSTTLFFREHRRVRLTEAGGRFLADVALGLSHIHKSAEALRAQATGVHVTLSASTAFAAYWMVPRLERFRQEVPGIDLRIQTADRDLDLVAERISLGIRGGSAADWPHYALQPLAPEEIYAVCGPGYAARHGLPGCVEELAGHSLIHLEEPFRPATTWRDFLAAAGVDARHGLGGLRINDYVLVIQSVIAGQGIALGWRHLTDRLVEEGVLIRPLDGVLVTGKHFHVAWPKDTTLSEPARRVRDWLCAQEG